MSSQFNVLTDNSGVFEDIFNQLSSSPTLHGVSIRFGEEETFDLDMPLPMVVFYPTSETYYDNKQGYIENLDPSYSIVWWRRVKLEFMLWAISTEPLATSVQNADQINILIGNVLSAFRYSQPTLIKFLPKNSHWETFRDAKSRYGRSYHMTVDVDIPVLSPTPEFATVRTVEIDEIIEDVQE